MSPPRRTILDQSLDIYRSFNAAAEAFFGTLNRELANRRRWVTRADARQDLIRWIEGWYNGRRLHSILDYNSPVEIEDLYYRRSDGIAA